jgi:predicted outer membrane repeat protein
VEEGGVLMMNGSAITSNKASYRSGMYNGYGGAGLCNQGTADLSDCTISANVASYDEVQIRGGGVLNTVRSLTFFFRARSPLLLLPIARGRSKSCCRRLASPHALTRGLGGTAQGMLTMRNTTVSANRAERGGAIFNTGAIVLSGSTICDNIAASDAALANEPEAGALGEEKKQQGSITLHGGSISNNSVVQYP